MLLAHLMRPAASRIFWTAGSRRPIRMPMIAMTTSNSTSVKPVLRDASFMIPLDKRKVERKPSRHGDNTEELIARPQFLTTSCIVTGRHTVNEPWVEAEQSALPHMARPRYVG